MVVVAIVAAAVVVGTENLRLVERAQVDFQEHDQQEQELAQQEHDHLLLDLPAQDPPALAEQDLLVAVDLVAVVDFVETDFAQEKLKRLIKSIIELSHVKFV